MSFDSPQKILILFVCLVMSGCVSNPTASFNSNENTAGLDVFDNWDEGPLVDIDDNADSGITYWIQPKNLSSQCKLWLNKKSEYEDIDFYWDGECKDGYAIGLGRVFAKGFMRDDESIVYYEDSGQKPVLIATYYKLTDSMITLGFKNDDAILISKLSKDTDFGTYLEHNVYNNSYKSKNGITYKVSATTTSPATRYEKQNSSKYFSWYEANLPLSDVTALVMSRGKESLDTTVYRNGELDSKKDNSLKVFLPRAYMENAFLTKKEIEEKILKAAVDINTSQDYLKFYVKRACNSPVEINGIQREEYKGICGNNNYFSKYDAEIKEAKNKFEELQKQIFSMKVSRNNSLQRSQSYESEESSNTMNNGGVSSSFLPKGLSLPAPVELYQPPKANAPTYFHYNGKSIVGSDGSRCTAVGNSVVCN